MDWDSIRINRPSIQRIKLNRTRISEIVAVEKTGNGPRMDLRTAYANDLIALKGNRKSIEMDHYINLVKSNMPLEQYKELVLHPHNQFQLDRLKFPYHMWLRFRGTRGWQTEMLTTLGLSSNHIVDSILVRIQDIKLPIGNNFMDVYQERITRNGVYCNDIAGTLDYVKNAIHHCNDKSKVNVCWRELEEVITSTFPELAVYITNYCIIKGISIKELIEDCKFGTINVCAEEECARCRDTDDLF